MPIMQLIQCIILIVAMGNIGAMDDAIDTTTQERSWRDKKSFIRDLFTSHQAWDMALSQQESPNLCARSATSYYKSPAQQKPSAGYRKIIEANTEAQKRALAAPTVLYKNDTHTYIGSVSGNLHVIAEPTPHEYTYEYVELHHPEPITAIVRVSPQWLALAGGTYITWYDTDRIYRAKRTQLSGTNLNPGNIINADVKYGVLITTHETNTQYKIYPYSWESAFALHGHEADMKEMDLDKLELFFHTALAIHNKKSIFICTKEEFDTISTLPSDITALIHGSIKLKIKAS